MATNTSTKTRKPRTRKAPAAKATPRKAAAPKPQAAPTVEALIDLFKLRKPEMVEAARRLSMLDHLETAEIDALTTEGLRSVIAHVIANADADLEAKAAQTDTQREPKDLEAYFGITVPEGRRYFAPTKWVDYYTTGVGAQVA